MMRFAICTLMLSCSFLLVSSDSKKDARKLKLEKALVARREKAGDMAGVIALLEQQIQASNASITNLTTANHLLKQHGHKQSKPCTGKTGTVEERVFNLKE